jgi:multiple sugar transport system substrate-binding protein
MSEHDLRLGRRMALRSIITGASAFGLASLLSACGQSIPPIEATQQPVAQPEAPLATPTTEQTITVWYYDNSIRPTVDAFQQAHPTIGVDLQTFGDADQGLLRALKSGSGVPDVSVFFSVNAGAIAQGGGLADLAAAPYDAASLKSAFVASAWQGGLDTQGRLIGLPLSISPATYWYRADLLAAAGVESDPEKLRENISDWAALFSLAQEYREKQAESSLLPRVFGDVFIPQLLQQGGGLVEDSRLMLNEKATLPAQEALRARTLKLDLDLVEGGTDWDEAIRTGRIAGIFSPSWFQGYISEIYSNLVGLWRSIPVPGTPLPRWRSVLWHSNSLNKAGAGLGICEILLC